MRRESNSIRNLTALIAFVVMQMNLSGQEQPKMFRDTLDGAFDISRWLFELHGFIPLVSVITEPALGYGGVLAGTYFIPKKGVSPGQFKMPDIVGAGVGYTQNGTWFLGGMYAGFWKNDRIRYRGVLGYGNINLKYYGTGDGYLATDPATFTIESLFFLQQGLFRIGETPFMLGGKYYLGLTEVTAFEDSKHPEVDPRDFEMTNSGIGLIGEYETFNNILSPSRGIRINLTYDQSLELLGGDRNLAKLTFFTLGYIPIMKRWNSGFRFETVLATRDSPFYMLPFIKLRGIPLMRYQGEWTILAETEQFVNVFRRWSLVGFTGIGTTAPSLDDVKLISPVWNAGSGFRYLIARRLGLQMGMDIARGPEDWAFYIVFGSGWLK
jgi:hypothetical protein